MRGRTIKPGFFKNEDLAKVDPLGRILFAGLWCLADRRGRLEYRPDRIKIEALPYDKAKVTDLITDLAKLGFVEIYEANSKRYIQVTNFEDHQNPHVREPESTMPAPDKHQSSTGIARPFPLSPYPLSGHPISDASAPSAPTAPEFDFDLVWRKYPKKIGRPEALRHFKATVKTPADWDAINLALEHYLAYLNINQTDRKFIKHGSTWFNQWRGWIEVDPNGSNDKPSPVSYIAQLRAKKRAEKTGEVAPPGETSERL